MISRHLLPVTVICLLAFAACSHQSIMAPPPKTPAPVCPGRNHTTPEDDLDPMFRVVRPYAGEILRAGDQCTVLVVSSKPTNFMIQIVDGRYLFSLPGPSSQGNLPYDSLFVFQVPAGIFKSYFDPVLGMPVDTTISLSSDSLLIKICTYSGGYAQYSECYFSVKP